MPYIPTQEDRDKLNRDREVLADTLERVALATDRLRLEHRAVPALSSVLDATVDSIFENMPPLMLFDAVLDGLIRDCLKQHMAAIYILGTDMGEQGYSLHEMPCAETGEGHLHEVEDILKSAEED